MNKQLKVLILSFGLHFKYIKEVYFQWLIPHEYNRAIYYAVLHTCAEYFTNAFDSNTLYRFFRCYYYL